MPKPIYKLAINLNLLKPQSNPEKLFMRLFRWLLSTGRYIFVFVEALVLIAFIARFKLDADLATRKEKIEEQVAYIKSLRADEILIRQTQLKLSTIDSMKTNSLDWPTVIKKIADQTPQSVRLTSINITKNVGNATVHITGQTENSIDLGNFVSGLKEDNTFSDVNIASINLEENTIKFTIDSIATLTAPGEKSS